MTSVRGRHDQPASGQSLVEFAMVLPIIVLLIAGFIEIGRAVFAYNGLTNAAREGARLAAVNQDVNLIKQRVQTMTFGTSITNLASPTFVRFFQEGPTLSPVTITRARSRCAISSAIRNM